VRVRKSDSEDDGGVNRARWGGQGNARAWARAAATGQGGEGKGEGEVARAGQYTTGIVDA
jgi:hypothetical protein